MRSKLMLRCLAWLLAGLWLSAFAVAAEAKELKLKALLVWATNDESAEYKSVDSEVLKRLRDLPLKWSNYYVVNRVLFSVPEKGTQGATLSDKCRIEVTSVKGDHIEVALIGKGQPVLKRTQPLAEGKMLVLGGNAPGENGWLVVLKRTD